VLKTSISDTNETRRHLRHSLMRDLGPINDCLLQPMLHVDRPLLQFADITDPLLSTAALFSRFYSQGIHT